MFHIPSKRNKNKTMTLKEKLQAKLNELLAERETTQDKYWIDLEIEAIEEKLANAST